MKHLLQKIYGKSKSELALDKILPLIDGIPKAKKTKTDYFSEKDVVLITYGDLLKKKGEMPLSTLYGFAKSHFKGIFSAIHILPFFPFSSDDGFSVTDYTAVDPEIGTWKDIKRIGDDFELMSDLVLNHISAKSMWFKNYLEGKKGYEDLAIEVDPATDLSQVTRPRSLPLLTVFEKKTGQKVHIWTTFSADQIDLNFESFDVLEKMVKVLLFYVKQGATMIRLDAIAYLWKKIGTNCIHLSETHDVVKLFRKILDAVAPDVLLITETNVPHAENISYFGDGNNEAQMVYNFTLPPLMMYSFISEDATYLSRWARGLFLESENTTFFNFSASHDGVGVRPLEGILSAKEIDSIIKIVKQNGGQVSYKNNPDGSKSPYELNITYIDALSKGEMEPDDVLAKKFLASQAIQFALPGVPAVYIHSILGSRNWLEGVKKTQMNRTINREKLQVDKVLAELKNPDSFRAKVFFPYVNLIKVRRNQPAFHPNAPFEILDIDPKIFVIVRSCREQTIYALTNISSQPVRVRLTKEHLSLTMTDLLTGTEFDPEQCCIDPYRSVWLSPSIRKYSHVFTHSGLSAEGAITLHLL